MHQGKTSAMPARAIHSFFSAFMAFIQLPNIEGNQLSSNTERGSQ